MSIFEQTKRLNQSKREEEYAREQEEERLQKIRDREYKHRDELKSKLEEAEFKLEQQAKIRDIIDRNLLGLWLDEAKYALETDNELQKKIKDSLISSGESVIEITVPSKYLGPELVHHFDIKGKLKEFSIQVRNDKKSDFTRTIEKGLFKDCILGARDVGTIEAFAKIEIYESSHKPSSLVWGTVTSVCTKIFG